MRNLEHGKRIVTDNTRLATFRNGLALCAAIAVATASLSAQAAWTYDADAKTLSNGTYSFSAKVVTKTDPSNSQEVTGLEITGKPTAGSGDLDFTDVEKDTNYKLISFSYYGVEKFVDGISGCTKFVAPDLMQLGRQMFQDYTALAEVVVSDKLTTFPQYCFNEATALTKITPTAFPYVATVEQSVFCKTGIESISLPSVTTIKDYAFLNCQCLTGDLSFPLLETAGCQAFCYATKITSFSAPKLKQVEGQMFRGCSEITNIVVGADCQTNFANGCYSICPKLENITPAPVITSLSVSPFSTESQDTAYFKSNPLVIKVSGTTSISGSYMKNIPSLKHIEITCENIESVGAWAFQNIADDAEITWEGPAPTTIDDYAFYGDVNSKLKRKRLIVKGGDANLESWKSSTYFSELTEDDKTGKLSADYQEAKKLGRVKGRIGSYLWLVKGETSGLMIIIR